MGSSASATLTSIADWTEPNPTTEATTTTTTASNQSSTGGGDETPTIAPTAEPPASRSSGNSSNSVSAESTSNGGTDAAATATTTSAASTSPTSNSSATTSTANGTCGTTGSASSGTSTSSSTSSTSKVGGGGRTTSGVSGLACHAPGETPANVHHSLFRLPFLDALEGCNNILIAGCGGGFDMFSGIPLYFALKAQHRNVHLANLSFSKLPAGNSEVIGKICWRITTSSVQPHALPDYAPEYHFLKFMQARGEELCVYCIVRDDYLTGVVPMANVYQILRDRLSLDAIILVDGGTDSMMLGDEETTGTLIEDHMNMAAVDLVTGLRAKLLVCLGFGVDKYHGVNHALFLENVAEAQRCGGFFGLWSMLPTMDEARMYEEIHQYIGEHMDFPSIVCNSILTSMCGGFGDYHPKTIARRTQSSNLFLNPLMSTYWAFDSHIIMRNCVRYYNHRVNGISCWETSSINDLMTRLGSYRRQLRGSLRPNTTIPL
ncbi:cell surface glycoprotein [Pelomyxa schiedti]|nr:cell surface glycoprotein [Pelomyxa schiedti]